MSSKPNIIFYPAALPLDVNWFVYPEKIQVTKDINKAENIHFAYITYIFKNNMSDVIFKNVKIYIPNSDVDTMESPKARRDTNTPWQQPYGMFSIDKILPNETYVATISAFVFEPKTYNLTSVIIAEGNGKYIYDAKAISFTAY